MKMGKASQGDIDAAIELYQFLQAMSNGRSAEDVVDEFGYGGYQDLLERQASDIEFALRAHERGGLFRVVWGMQVLLDPRNEIVDPILGHLELHPKHVRAARACEAVAALETVATKQQKVELRDAAHRILHGYSPCMNCGTWSRRDEGHSLCNPIATTGGVS